MQQKEENINNPKKVIEQLNMNPPSLSPSTSSNKISYIYIGIALIILLLLSGGAYYYFFIMKKNYESNVVSEQPIYPVKVVTGEPSGTGEISGTVENYQQPQ
jgi:hypothetical protein